jgi:cyclophilin family peptidyl-prolyl cis-trans isomerase
MQTPVQRTYAAPFPLEIQINQLYYALITTHKGIIQIQLNTMIAPLTVNNFVTLARRKYYDGLTFHRVVPGFVVQGGCPNGDGRGGPGYQFDDEKVTSDYLEGTVAMANAGKNTNGSQFFICLEDLQGKLEKAYTIFGKTIDGMDVVHAMHIGDIMQSVAIGETPFPKAVQ